jgi:hypothetical protein
VLPKIKSWRDAGDTPYRKNHREEAKLGLLLHTPSPRIAKTKTKLNNKQQQQKKRHIAKRAGHPEYQRGGGAILH